MDQIVVYVSLLFMIYTSHQGNTVGHYEHYEHVEEYWLFLKSRVGKGFKKEKADDPQ